MALKEYKNNNTKTVVILAECWNGAVNASRFAARLLFNENTRIILLHTYMRPSTGIIMIRDITPILKKIAEEELVTLENRLVNEFELPAENIEKIAIEGNLGDIMETYFGHYTNLSVVLGPGMDNQYFKDSCRNTVKTIMNARPRPLFLISDFITLIEKNRINIITEKEENVSQAYIDFLEDISADYKPRIEIISSDNQKRIEINKETANHFSDLAGITGISSNSAEQILINSLLHANTA